MVSKGTLKTARQLLDRFFRDAEGKTNRQLDVYFTVQSLDLNDRADPAIEFLVSRGLINLFGPDIGFLTDKGVQAVIDDFDLADLPKEIRDFSAPPPSPPQPSGAAMPAGPMPVAAPASRPDRATLTHIDLDGQEFAVELGTMCTIGRSDGNTIQVGDKRASKHHAEIRYEGGQFILRDLESANGTLLNGEYVLKPVVLQHDDEVVIGRTMLLYTAPASLESTEAPTTAADGAAAAFRVLQGTPAPSTAATDPYQSQDLAPSGDLPVHLAATERPAPAAGTGDLFAEEARSNEDDLFERPTRGSSNLFESKPPPGSADPFVFSNRTAREGSRPSGPAAPAGDDLFATAPAPSANSSPAGAVASDLLVGPATGLPLAGGPVSAEHPSLEVTSLADGLQESLQGDSLEEIEPFESLDDEPDAEWAHDTRAEDGPLLENQPVIQSSERPPDGASTSAATEPTTDDMATLTVSRDDLFGHSNRPQIADPPWGETADNPAGPTRADSGARGPAAAADPVRQLPEYAEKLPIAEVALASAAEVDVRAPAADAFIATLQALRRRLDRVDVPEKRALLDAVEVLSQHPYVRVVLDSLDE